MGSATPSRFALIEAFRSGTPCSAGGSEIDWDAEGFPELLARSSEVLWGALAEALREVPGWARLLGSPDHFGVRHRRFRDQLEAILVDAEDRVSVKRRAGELKVSFGGDTNQAGPFARSVPGFVLRGRFTDVVRLDLAALEREMGLDVGRRQG